MGPYSRQPLLPIARHAKELIEHSSEHLEKGTEKDLLIALVHVDNAVEIMLKEHMRFKKNMSWGQIEKMFFPQLLDACVNDLESIENNKNQFVAFHDIRNSLYHAGTFVPRKEDVESAIYFSKLLFNEMHPSFSFDKIDVKTTSDDTMNFLAKEFGKSKPYVTETDLTKKLAMLMNRQGYHVILNPIIAGTSLMADLLLSRKNEVIVVEVKARTAGNSILNSSVYQLCGYVEAVKRATPTKKVEGWLVTNANFSQAARKAAENVGVRLIPGNELKEMLARIGNHQPYFF